MRFNFVWVLHLLRRCLGDRMQISLFMWGYFKFNHRWGLGQKVFLPAPSLLSLLPITLSSPLQKVSAQVASGSGDVRGGRFSTSKQEKGKDSIHFASSSNRLKKSHVHWGTSYSVFLEGWWIYGALNHSPKSRLKLGGARISVKCSSVGKGRVWRAVKLDRREKD